MYFFGSASNLPLQSSQQNPIFWPSYSTVFVGLTSLPLSGPTLLIRSQSGLNAISFPDSQQQALRDAFFFLNSFTLPMYFLGSPSNLLLQSSQQNPIF